VTASWHGKRHGAAAAMAAAAAWQAGDVAAWQKASNDSGGSDVTAILACVCRRISMLAAKYHMAARKQHGNNAWVAWRLLA